MVSDSIINVSVPNASKDLGKKKRANRSARLKQCKLDARREQWLSQVKNSGCKKELNGGGTGGGGGESEFNVPKVETCKKGPRYKDLEVISPTRVEEIHHDSDSELSPANSPMSSISGGNDSGNNYSGTSSSSSSSSSHSSFGSGGCCSGCITEDEEGGSGGRDDGGDDGCLDDWEAVADALAAATSNDKQGENRGPDMSSGKEKETGFQSDSTAELTITGPQNVDGRSDKRVAVNNQAWRPNDAFRPRSLPSLSKQRSFPGKSERHSCCHVVNPWVRNNVMSSCVPTLCPICCEDLDLTDSSFLPCSCGFRLCLFCHKRILEEDGRCPGCRKPYGSDPVDKETSVSGSNLTIRLGRSCSMFSRV